MLVVMADVGAHDLLRMRLRLRRPHRRPNHSDAFGAEHLVEAARELAVAIADEETHRLLLLGERHRQVARLLGDPTFGRIRHTFQPNRVFGTHKRQYSRFFVLIQVRPRGRSGPSAASRRRLQFVLADGSPEGLDAVVGVAET
jgi:hypothetical protein